MTIDEMIAFDAVVKHRSVSAAADALNITQSAVTRRVQNLEESLGVELLSRETRPARPTPMGLRIFEQTRSALHQFDQISNLVQEDATPEGLLRIGIPQFLSEAVAVSAIRALRAQYPALDLRITTALSPALLHGVENGALDTAVIVMPSTGILPIGMSGHRLARLHMSVVAARGEFAADTYRLADLHDRGWILNPGECGFRNGLSDALAMRNLPMKLNLDVAGVEVQLGLVAAGLGLGLVPTHMVAGSRHAEDIAIIAVEDFALHNDLWLVRPPAIGRLTRAANDFGGFVRKAFS